MRREIKKVLVSEGDNELAKMQLWQLSSYALACCTIIRTDKVIYILASTEERIA